MSEKGPSPSNPNRRTGFWRELALGSLALLGLDVLIDIH